ncbi:hypothetical protein [Kribbella sp.]|uniref:hypothetical protein n=1 Tax=Kribbella sp. TaxID=1871183 RepID=UPI002D70F7EE|nr:hypothetical protein [Kribbella sp.]HZX01716.1 hypothetical protein [Kribbella sp.]
MPTYVRYQSPVPDRRGRRIGIFGLVNMLASRGYLTPAEERFRRTTNDWYDAAYTNPATAYEQNPHAASWFKPTAAHLFEPIPGYLKILAAHNLPCERYTSTTPGQIVYEDDHQVVVVPPADLTAPTTIMWLRPKVN